MTSKSSNLKADAAAARAAIMEQMRSGYGRMLGVEGQEQPQDGERLKDAPSGEIPRDASSTGRQTERRTSGPLEEDPRAGKVLAWIGKLRMEMKQEEVSPSGLLRLLSEALSVMESFLLPASSLSGEEADVLLLEARRILASVSSPAGDPGEVERALQLITRSIEHGKASGNTMTAAYQLRSRAYAMLAEMDRNRTVGR